MEKRYNKQRTNSISELQQNARRTQPKNSSTKVKSNGIRTLFKNLPFKSKGKQNPISFKPNSSLPTTIEEIKRLIALYKRFDSLYNPNNPQYKRKGADNIYYSEIAQHFPGTTTREIQEFIKDLRVIFEQEYWIIENARRVYGEVLDPSIEYFHDFLFLVPYMCSNESNYYYSTIGESQTTTSLNSQSIVSDPREFLKNVTELYSPSCIEESDLEDEVASSIGSEQQSLRTYINERRDNAYEKYFPHTGGQLFASSKKSKRESKSSKLDENKLEMNHFEDVSEKKGVNHQEPSHVSDSEGDQEPTKSALECQHDFVYNCSDVCSQKQYRSSKMKEDSEAEAPSPRRSYSEQTGSKCNKCWKKIKGGLPKANSCKEQQVEMLCDMIRIELGSLPEDVYLDAKWRIIGVLRDIQKRKPNDKSTLEQTKSAKCQCHAKNKDGEYFVVCKKKCPFCSKVTK